MSEIREIDAFAVFTGMPQNGLEEEINSFFSKNKGEIEVIKRTLTVRENGEAEIIIGYQKKKVDYTEKVKMINLLGDIYNSIKELNKKISAENLKVIDLLICDFKRQVNVGIIFYKK